MIWLILYICGACLMLGVFSWQDRKFGKHWEDPASGVSKDALMNGRIFMTILWPLCLPIVLIMLLMSYSESAKDKKRINDWRKRG